MTVGPKIIAKKSKSPPEMETAQFAWRWEATNTGGECPPRGYIQPTAREIADAGTVEEVVIERLCRVFRTLVTAARPMIDRRKISVDVRRTARQIEISLSRGSGRAVPMTAEEQQLADGRRRGNAVRAGRRVAS